MALDDSGKSRSRPAIKAQTVAAPKGGGAIVGLGESSATEQQSGTFSLTIPLSPPAARGLEPDLAISYSSSGGQGEFGLGFAVSRGGVSRRTSLGTPRYDHRDVFVLAGTELCAMPGDPIAREVGDRHYKVTRYRLRVEQDFDLIEHWVDQDAASADGAGDFWRTITADNRMIFYGQESDARIADPAKPDHVFEWLPEWMFDAKGNALRYRYKAEDTVGVSANSISEASRTATANRYLERICYANDRPIAPAPDGRGLPADVIWHFEIVFDYGEYRVDPANDDPYQPVQAWLPRPDPFSTYAAGFERRTHRLCRNVLTFHRFEALGSNPVMKQVVSLVYSLDPRGSQLTSATHTGYRYRAKRSSGQRYIVKSMPPLSFGYTAFDPGAADFVPFGDGDLRLPEVEQAPRYSLTDLFGEGVPGLLYADATSTLYCEPRRIGTSASVGYAPPSALPQFPNLSIADGSVVLTDLDGDGCQELVLTEPGAAGFFRANPDRSWSSFAPLGAFPTSYSDAYSELVDITGDGLSDLVRVQQDSILYLASIGTDGYDGPVEASNEFDVPALNLPDAERLTLFADLLGSGRAQRVRVANGRIDCWPILGYGRFAPAVTLANAPRVAADFDIARVYFADLDGSGPADCIIAYADRIEIFFNQSGNGFATEPLVLRLPAAYASREQISFADLAGSGTQCLIFSQDDPTPRAWSYDFCNGQKPHLLQSIDNGRGISTHITYRSSVHYYLDDKRAGIPWLTTLPSPIQVVARHERYDAISDTRQVHTYRYRHGYYDGVEREFRGFAMVEREDAETSTLPSSAALAPPLLERTWFDTGARPAAGPLRLLLAGEYFSGDAQACAMPPDVFVWPDGFVPDTETLRQAHAALAGTVLRSEIYGLDDHPHRDVPLMATEANATLRLLQPPTAPGNRASFFVHEREEITYHYERVAADPRVAHLFTLDVDDTGNVTRACEISYRRRPSQPVDDPQQAELRARCTVFVPVPAQLGSDIWLHGLPQAEQAFEINNIGTASGALYFEFAALDRLVSAALATGDAGHDGEPAAHLLSWERWSYVEDGAGTVTPQALLRSVRTAEFIASDLAAVLAPAGLPGDLATTLSRSGGFQLADGCWWRSGPTESYAPAGQFFLPEATTDAFAMQPDGPPGSISKYTYDSCHLLLVAIDTTSTGADVLADRIAVTRMDYQALLPSQVTESSGRIAEVLFDPLDAVIVASHRGLQQVDGAPAQVGFSALPDPDIEDWPAPASAADLIVNAGRYLQGAASFTYADVDSWRREAIPAHTVQIEASEYPDPHNAAIPVGDLRIAVEYDDGFGRKVQSAQKVEPGEAIASDGHGEPVFKDGVAEMAVTADRWLTTGATIFNNKNQPYKEYEPFYRDSWRYMGSAGLRNFGSSPTYYYDALSRPVRTSYQRGTMTEALFSRTERTPWSVTHWDQNDTIKSSAYFRGYVEPGGTQPPLSPFDKNALVKAAAHDGTPTTAHLSCDGHTVRIVQRLGTGDGQQLATVMQIDIEGRTTAVADPRIATAGGWNLKLVYGLGRVAIATISADAGTSFTLSNALGNPLLALDASGQLVTHAYDGSHRVVATLLQDLSARTPARMVERVVYGDSLDQRGLAPFPDRDGRNLRGRIWLHYDEAGEVEVPAHSILGAPLGSLQRFVRDARSDPDWSAVLPTDGWSWADLRARLVPALDPEVFASSYAYDALDQSTIDSDPGGNRRRIERHVSGRIKAIYATPSGATEFPYLKDITYTANNNRAELTLASPDNAGFATRSYGYDPDTLLLTRLTTRRKADGKVLQDLSYAYDPVGNLTHVADLSGLTGSVVRNGQTVSPDLDYSFDALYRLTAAEGRAHLALSSGAEADPGCGQMFAPDLNDGSAIEAYLMRYGHDDGGNLTTTRYISPASSPSSRWTRTMSVASTSNRAVDAGALAGGDVDSWFDANGNQIRSAGLAGLGWSYRNALRRAVIIDRGPNADSDAQYNVYDATGQRVRTLIQRQTAATLQSEETLYLGNLEIMRSRQGDRLTGESRRWRLMDVDTCIAERLIWTGGTPPAGLSQPQLRYQLDNEQGSAMMEVDEVGHIISYEEYSPYGSTVYATGISLAEVSLKRYRYSGRRRDEVTGFYYYGARHYAPWLGRWLTPDPSGTTDGLNLYAFLAGNPVSYVDADGMGKRPQKGAAKVSHRSLHTESEAIGVLIANEMGSDKTPVKFFKDKYNAVLKEAGGEIIHKESKVIEAIGYGLNGNGKEFGDAYRAAAKGTDEHMSTTTVFHVLKGIGSVTKTLSADNLEKLYFAVKIASVFRLPTEQSGYNFGSGESMQHPASSSSAVFDRSAKNHGRADLDRRLSVVKAGSDGTGFHRLLNMAAEGALHSLNEFSAPTLANNQHLKPKLTVSFKRKYDRRRELVKRQFLVLRGRDVAKYQRQKETANYRRRTDRDSNGRRRDRSPSPLRGTP